MAAIVTMPERFGLPAVPSRRIPCSRCGGSTWWSDVPELGAEDAVLCVVCAMAVVKPGDAIEPAPWVLADLAEAIREGDT